MAIGTAATPENVNFIMDNLDIHKYFQGIVHARHVKKGKPDPANFCFSSRIDEFDPQTMSWYLKTSLAGAHTAKNAGCHAVIVTTTHC